MQTVPHRFQPHDLVAGHAALDLVNTVTARDSTPSDWLADPAALWQWALLAGCVDERTAARLERAGAGQPAAARAALGRCRALREALHDALVALQLGRPVPAASLAGLERARQAALRRAPLVATRDGIRAQATFEASGLDLVTDTLVMQALPLLEAPPLQRLRVCDGTHCGWLFIDASKAGRRRWCDMATCGAAHKAERLRQRSAPKDTR
ncbi:MAG: CGNR zinc finger domain-containing protein [Rubrivivax sp.]